MKDQHSKSSESYDVGYKKPPKQHQFKKGKSGNPKGRPKKPPKPDIPDDFQELFANALIEPVTVKKNGKQCQITKNELLVQKLINDAISGSATIRIQIIKMLYAMDVPQKAEERWGQKIAAMTDQELWTPEMEKALQKLAAMFIEADDDDDDSL